MGHTYYVILPTSRTRHVFGVFDVFGWPLKTSCFPDNFRKGGPISIIFTPKLMVFMNANRICKVYIVLHIGNFKSHEIMIRNIFKIRSFFAFNEKILENKAEYPIQILDYSQVFSYQNRFMK